MSGQKIIEGLDDAIAGRVARLTRVQVSKPKRPARSNVEERLKQLEKMLKQLREDVALLKARTHRSMPIG